MVEQLDIEDVMDLSDLEQRAIQTKRLFGDSRFEKKDVYAISKRPEDPEAKTYFEIRKHMDHNDQLMGTKAYDQIKSAVKLVECGLPVYAKATAEQLQEIPQKNGYADAPVSLVQDTFKHVQKNKSLGEQAVETFLPRYSKIRDTARKLGILREPDPVNFLQGKDVYALTDNPGDDLSPRFWDVRNYNENNDDKVIERANDWGRKVVKVVENGEPLLPRATKKQLAQIPISSQKRYDFSDIVTDTFHKVQGGLNLDEYNLQQSVNELSVLQSNEMNM